MGDANLLRVAQKNRESSAFHFFQQPSYGPRYAYIYFLCSLRLIIYNLLQLKAIYFTIYYLVKHYYVSGIKWNIDYVSSTQLNYS